MNIQVFTVCSGFLIALQNNKFFFYFKTGLYNKINNNENVKISVAELYCVVFMKAALSSTFNFNLIQK